MNKVLYLMIAFLAVLFISCNSNKFEINGTIENAAGKTILLNKAISNAIEVVDSAKIDQNGHFQLKDTLKSPTFLYLGFYKNKNYIHLIVSPGDKIIVNGDYETFSKKYTITGSKESELMHNLNMHLYENLDKTKMLGDTFKQNLENPRLDSIKRSLDRQFRKLTDDYKAYLIKYINENSSSLSTMVALSQQIEPGRPVIEVDENFKLFLMVDSVLNQKYPNTDQVKALSNYISRIKEEMKSKEIISKMTAIGANAPEIKLPDQNGKDISLSSLKGKVVLLDFWAGWCKPCREENPNLVKAYKKYRGKGFEILQVSLDKNRDVWTEAITKDGLAQWKHVSDLKFWNSEAAVLYNIQSIPANFLIDKRGMIVAKNLRGDALDIELLKVMY